MSKEKVSKKSLLERVRAIFADNTGGDPGSITNPESTISTTTSDGKAVIVTKVDTNATEPMVGDSVTVDGVLPAAGDIILADNSTVTVDETGKITAIKEADDIPASTVDPGAAATNPPAATTAGVIMAKTEKFAGHIAKLTKFDANASVSADELQDMFAKFAEGTPEERIANLEIVCRALMEYSFGWQLREAQAKQTTDQAINVYKNSLQPVQALAAKHEKIIPELFTLVENVVELPQNEPETISEKKKSKLLKQDKIEEKFNKITDALKELKENKLNK